MTPDALPINSIPHATRAGGGVEAAGPTPPPARDRDYDKAADAYVEACVAYASAATPTNADALDSARTRFIGHVLRRVHPGRPLPRRHAAAAYGPLRYVPCADGCGAEAATMQRHRRGARLPVCTSCLRARRRRADADRTARRWTSDRPGPIIEVRARRTHARGRAEA